MNTARLSTLESIPSALVWRGNSLVTPVEKGLPTGFSMLDVELPGGGWPRSAITELLCDHPGSVEIAPLHPLLRRTPAHLIPPCGGYSVASIRLKAGMSTGILVSANSPLTRHPPPRKL